MRNILSYAITLASLSTVACNSSVKNDSTPQQDSLPPVETQKSNTDYAPAFEGQTRAPGALTKTPYEAILFAEGLQSPWGIAVLPDGRLLITEKEGTLRLIDNSGVLSQPITGLPAVDSNGQGGALGIALDPDFSTNRIVYWAFSKPEKNGNQTVLAKGRLSDDEKTIENVTVIYEANPIYNGKLHYGGRLLFDKEGNILLTVGERSDLETREKAQDLNAAIGKIVRLTKDGKPASGNPFINKENALPEIYSYGHRNPQGLALHPETGTLYSSEFGPRGGDELNKIEAGKNYGWPIITYGIEYSGKEIGTPPIQQQEGLEQPVYYWDPVLSPSGMTFYSAEAIPEWKNNLFIAGLSSTHIARLILDKDKVIGEERLLSKEGQRFRDIVQGNNGELYTITDGGRVYKIAKK